MHSTSNRIGPPITIRDDSGQDLSLNRSPLAETRRRRAIAGGIAEVQRGDPARDLSTEDRAISANSPTLCTIAAGTVTLKADDRPASQRHRQLGRFEPGRPVGVRSGLSAHVMNGDIAVKRPLRTGASSLGTVEIFDGANVGDRIEVSCNDPFGDA